MITESWLSSLESLWLLKRATVSHAIAITPEISLLVAIRKKTTSISKYSRAELQGYGKLFNYIRTNLLQNPRIVRLSELSALFTSFVNSQGELEIPESTRIHFRRSLEKEFRDAIDFEDLYGNNRIFAIPRNLSRLDLAKQVTEKSNTISSSTSDTSLTAFSLREAIQAQDTEAT